MSQRLWTAWWLMLLVSTAGLQYRLWTGEGSFNSLWRLEADIAVQQKENAGLRSRNHDLETEVLELRLGQGAIEERARSQLGMVHPDETFYLFRSLPVAGRVQEQGGR